MTHGVDLAALLLRAVLALTMFAHGWNHAFGGGKLAGTARWFDSIGMRPAKLHALVATLTELGVAPLLVLGLLTPLAAAGVVGVMLVALISNHMKNGFFIFRPGEGYEYVLFITMTALSLGALGGGRWSIDRVIAKHGHGVGHWLHGWHGLLIAAVLGGAGAAFTLITGWRPNRAVAGTAAG